MTHTEIVNKVKSILNEHGEVDAVSIGEDRVLLEDYIESAIPDAVVMLASKGYRVNAKRALADDWEDVDIQDFVSLIRATTSGWKRDVTKITEKNSPEYVMSQNEFTKPGVNSPMVVLVDNSPYGKPNGTTVFVEYNAKYDGQNLNAGEKEATAVCYMAAALVLGLFGDDLGKQRLSDVATNMLQ